MIWFEPVFSALGLSQRMQQNGQQAKQAPVVAPVVAAQTPTARSNLMTSEEWDDADRKRKNLLGNADWTNGIGAGPGSGDSF